MSSVIGEDLTIHTDSNGSRSVIKDKSEKKHHKHKKEKKKDKKKEKKKHKHKHKDKDREKSKDHEVKGYESSPRDESVDSVNLQEVLEKKEAELSNLKDENKEVCSDSKVKVSQKSSEIQKENATNSVRTAGRDDKSDNNLADQTQNVNLETDIPMPESLDDIPVPAQPSKSHSDSKDSKGKAHGDKVTSENTSVIVNTTEIEIENVPLPPPPSLDSIPIPDQVNPSKKKVTTEKVKVVKPSKETAKINPSPVPPPEPPPPEKPSINIPTPSNFQATIRESMLREVGNAETGLPQNIVDDFFKDFLASKMKQIESEYKLMTKQLALEGQKKEGDGVASSVEEMNKLLDEELSTIATATQENDKKKSSKWDSKEKSATNSGEKSEVMTEEKKNEEASNKPKVEVQIGTKKGGKLQMEFKITKTSADMISSGEIIGKKNLEDGEVSSSDNDSESEESDENGDVSGTGSLSDSDKDSKSSKKKKKKKEKKKKKKKHKSRESSESESRSKRKHSHKSRSRSPKRRRSSRSRSRERSSTSTSKYIYDAYQYRDKVRDSYERDRDRRYDRDRGQERRSYNDRDLRDDRGRHRRRSTSRSRSRSRSKSRERPFRMSADLRVKIDKAKLREIAIKNAIAMAKSGQVPNIDLAAIKSGGKSIDELTDFCKRISSKSKHRRDSSSSSSSEEEAEDKKEEDEEFIHHPFKVKDTSSIVLNIRDSKPLPIRTPAEKLQGSANLRLQFPVSSGSTHRQKESEWVPVEKTTAVATTTTSAPATTTASSTTTADSVLMPPPPVPSTAPLPVDVPPNPVRPEDRIFPETPNVTVDIGSIISERLSAFKKLKENPHDIEAMTTLGKVQEKASLWAQSKNLPGKFMGSTGAHVMSQEELIGPDKKRQAWARRKRKTKAKPKEFKNKYSTEVVKKIIYRSLNRRYYKPLKDQFVKAAPLQSGIGMALLQKMGWKQGEGLGKNNEGSVEPLALDFKTDRRGLTSTGEQVPKTFKGGAPVVRDLSGKHPVSALVELCNRRKWGAPVFELVHESGPDHKKNFLFKVIVNRTEYQPTVAMNNKKSAKAAAATCCLQVLGLVPREPPS